MNLETLGTVAAVRYAARPGATDREVAEHWGRDLVELAQRLDPPLLVVDLAEAQQIGPHTLASLVRAQRRLSGRGGQMILARVAPTVRDVLQIAGLGQEFPLAASYEQAVQQLSSPTG